MRLRAWGLGLLGAIVVLVACGDDSVLPPANVQPDASPDASPPTPPSADADADADADAAEATTILPPAGRGVDVTIDDEYGLLRHGIRLVFHDEDGEPIDETYTNELGEARTTKPASMVTVVELGIENAALFTVMGIKDGEHIQIRLQGILPPKETLGRYQLAWPQLSNADRYFFTLGSCVAFAPGNTTGTELVANATCARPEGNTLFGLSIEGPAVSAFGSVANVPATDANLTIPEWRKPRHLPYRVQNLPADFQANLPAMTQCLGASCLGQSEAVHSLPNEAYEFLVAEQADALIFTSYATKGSETVSSSLSIQRRVAPPVADDPIAFDYSSGSLPILTQTAVRRTVPRRPDVGFTSTLPMTASDVMRLTVEVGFRTGAPGVLWDVVGSGSTTTVRLPALPSALFSAPDFVSVDVVGLGFVADSASDGFAAFKGRPLRAHQPLIAEADLVNGQTIATSRIDYRK